MKLRANKGGHGYVTSYTLSVGCKEAREAGMLNDDGTSKPIKKTVDAKNHRIIIELEEETN